MLIKNVNIGKIKIYFRKFENCINNLEKIEFLNGFNKEFLKF